MSTSKVKSCKRPKCQRTVGINKFGFCSNHSCPTPYCDQSRSSQAVVCDKHIEMSRLPLPKKWLKVMVDGIVVFLNDEAKVAQFGHPGVDLKNALPRSIPIPAGGSAKRFGFFIFACVSPEHCIMHAWPDTMLVAAWSPRPRICPRGGRR